MCQADASFGGLAQQGCRLRGAARAAFMVKQHHRQVVLAERMAALRGGPEVMPRLDMVAHEPGWPALPEVQIQVRKGQWVGWFDLGAGGAHTGKKQGAKQVAHDPVLRTW